MISSKRINQYASIVGKSGIRRTHVGRYMANQYWKSTREREGCGNMAESQNTSETNPFSKEQLEVLQKMLQQTLQGISVPIGTCSLG